MDLSSLVGKPRTFPSLRNPGIDSGSHDSSYVREWYFQGFATSSFQVNGDDGFSMISDGVFSPHLEAKL
jgi:hypothetical protein